MIFVIGYFAWLLIGLGSIISIVLYETKRGWTGVARCAVLFVTLPLAVAGPLVPVVWFLNKRAAKNAPRHSHKG